MKICLNHFCRTHSRHEKVFKESVRAGPRVVILEGEELAALTN